MHPDVYPQPIFGPSLMIAGRSAGWNGSTGNRVGEIGVSCRVLLEAKVKERVVSTLDVQNNGTAAIYYSWKVEISFQIKINIVLMNFVNHLPYHSNTP